MPDSPWKKKGTEFTMILPCLLLLCLSLAPQHQCSESPACPPNLSIAVPEGNYSLQDDGVLVYAGERYPAHGYYRDDKGTLWACPCLGLSSTLPCLRKCCRHDEVISGNLSKLAPCMRAAAGVKPAGLRIEWERASQEMRDQLDSRPNLEDWFRLVVSPSCVDGHVFVDLHPENDPEDAYLIQADGRLQVGYSPDLLPVGGFCMDRQQRNNETIVVLACIVKTEESEQGLMPVLRIGSMLSVPFLAITFFVYAIIPELRNIYGKTLMCYVAALLAGYTSLSVSQFLYLGTTCRVIEKRNIAEAKNSKQCGQYELYKTCNPGCERTCDDLNNDDRSGDRCTGKKLACIDGCICKSGYVREREDGDCIRVQECPRVKH